MLWEGSGVTFGANQFTPVLEANKSIMDSEYLAKLNAEMDVLVKAVKNGKGTDERLENIEFKLKQIQQKYNALLELKSFDKDTLIESHEEKAETLKEATQEEVQKALKDAQLKEFYLNILN